MDTISAIMCLLVFGKLSTVVCDEDTNHNVFYQGFGDLILICNGSDVINITGVNLINHPTVCIQDTCTLSPNDTLSIETCNNNSTCKVPVHDMSGCITEKGFYNVRYTCNITGRLMVIKDGQSGETKLTNRVYSSPKQCLSFYYWGNNLGYLTVFREFENGSIDNVDQFPNANWTWKIFTRNLKNIGDYYLRFMATGSGSSQFMVDDIRLLNADCDESRDRIQYNQACRTADDITELEGCSKYYMENVISHLDPMKETCYNLFDEGHICDVSRNLIHCDARQLVERYPFCSNLNTLMINYTCKGKPEVSVDEEAQNKNDAINIGLIAGAVSGVIIVCLILCIVCRYHRRQKEGTQTMQNQSVLRNLNRPDTSSQAQLNRPEPKSSSLYIDTNPATSDSEHRHMTISSAYEAIVEPSNDYTNNQIPAHENDNHLVDNYNILDPNSIGKPNVYDDLASPNFTNSHNETANGNEYEEPMQGQVLDNYTTLDPNRRRNANVYDVLVSPSNTNTNDDIVNDYEEPVPGDYANCIEDECEYEQNN